MTRLLDDMPDLESRLLLYAAGELSVEDAQAVERELAENAAARARLADVRGLLLATGNALAAADAVDPIPARTVARASARVERMVSEWVDVADAGRLRLDPAAVQAGSVWHYARWPLAAAAVLVASLVLWNWADPVGRGGELALNPIVNETGAADPADPTRGPMAGLADAQASSERALRQAAALFDSPIDAASGPADDEFASADLRSDLSSALNALKDLSVDDWE